MEDKVVVQLIGEVSCNFWRARVLKDTLNEMYHVGDCLIIHESRIPREGMVLSAHEGMVVDLPMEVYSVSRSDGGKSRKARKVRMRFVSFMEILGWLLVFSFILYAVNKYYGWI